MNMVAAINTIIAGLLAFGTVLLSYKRNYKTYEIVALFSIFWGFTFFAAWENYRITIPMECDQLNFVSTLTCGSWDWNSGIPLLWGVVCSIIALYFQYKTSVDQVFKRISRKIADYWDNLMHSLKELISHIKHIYSTYRLGCPVKWTSSHHSDPAAPPHRSP